MTQAKTNEAKPEDVKRVDVRLLVAGHKHRGFEIPKGGKINVTETQAGRLVEAKRAERV